MVNPALLTLMFYMTAVQR